MSHAARKQRLLPLRRRREATNKYRRAIRVERRMREVEERQVDRRRWTTTCDEACSPSADEYTYTSGRSNALSEYAHMPTVCVQNIADRRGKMPCLQVERHATTSERSEDTSAFVNRSLNYQGLLECQLVACGPAGCEATRRQWRRRGCRRIIYSVRRRSNYYVTRLD